MRVVVRQGFYCMTKLESRFGDRHKVMNVLMNELDSAKTIRTPQQIQAFADDLYNARLSFNVMHCLDELTPSLSLSHVYMRGCPMIMLNDGEV